MGRVCLETESSSFKWDVISGITRTYTLVGYESRYAAEQALVLDPSCPSVDDDYGIYREDVNVDNEFAEADGLYDYKATVTWTPLAPSGVDREFISGSIQLVPVKQRLSYGYIAEYDSTGDVTNGSLVGYGLPIGGQEGVDSDAPAGGFQIERLYPKGTITPALTLTLRGYVGFPNSATWRGRAVGTVRITNIEYNDRDPHWDHITYNFAEYENEANIPFANIDGAQITVTAKRGWDHIEPIYYNVFNDNTKLFEPAGLRSVQVHQMKPYVDLNDII